ncbi:serine/threonine-protein kinase [Nocardioides sp.]|uniref:serine/threonine-protein kinase n=1 Tax=Nocardioides sp. TaxID=35761 RepID=UPI0039E49432
MKTRLAAPAIAGYRYVSDLGGGGFADVYLYEQELPARRVAIKVLREAVTAGAGMTQLQAEANVMAQLSGHPSIVAIYAADVAEDGRPYLVMEYCSLPGLSPRFRTERIGVAEVLDTGIRIASAVETAHRAGILHRDIKPQNVLTSAFGAPKLTDFGIAGTAGQEEVSYGLSVPWSPPESFAESPSADVRSDVWSLAATIYSLLAGRSPFEVAGGANDNPTLMNRIERQPLGRIRRADVGDSLNDLLARGMAKRVDDRPASAFALAGLLQDVQAELGLAQTRIEVFDSAAASEQAETDDQRTYIRPVSIIVPEALERHGTLLQPRFVSPVPDDTEQFRTPAGHALDTVYGPRVIGGARATEEPAAPDRPGRRGLLLGIGAVAVVAVAAGTVLLLGGGDSGGADAESRAAFEESVEPDALGAPGTYVAPPTATTAETSRPGTVTFTWVNPAPQPGDHYAVSYSIANQPQPVADLDVPRLDVRATAGAVVCAQAVVVRADSATSLPGDQICAGAA